MNLSSCYLVSKHPGHRKTAATRKPELFSSHVCYNGISSGSATTASEPCTSSAAVPAWSLQQPPHRVSFAAPLLSPPPALPPSRPLWTLSAAPLVPPPLWLPPQAIGTLSASWPGGVNLSPLLDTRKCPSWLIATERPPREPTRKWERAPRNAATDTGNVTGR